MVDNEREFLRFTSRTMDKVKAKFSRPNIKEMISAIVREVDPEQIYLFGSLARGTPHADSDIDLLIVEKKLFASFSKKHEELRRIRKALLEFPGPKDILVFSEPEVAQWRDSLNHIIGHCMREGKLLYDRS